jgi:AmmeMemoRadiSam system protein B
VVVILAPNHTGYWENAGGAAAWDRGSYGTPLGSHSIAEHFLTELEQQCDLVAHDPAAHLQEHAVEVELPFLSVLAADVTVAPIVLAWDDWERSRVLGSALAKVVTRWDDDVLLVASSDMTHYESASSAEVKDRKALDSVTQLDGEELLATCRRENVTMCGRAPAATVVEAARQLGATGGEVVDYRHSGLVTGDDSSVVAYAGVVIK